MANVTIRPAMRSDLPRLTVIYNHYVLTSAITFDLEPFTPAERMPWFEEHAGTERYRLLVAEKNGSVIGYAGSGRFRAKRAYDTTAETTIYCAPEAIGRGVGTALYDSLFAVLRKEDLNRLVAGVTLPNDASIALHRRFGFTQVGIFSANGRKFGRYWDVMWLERPLRLEK